METKFIKANSKLIPRYTCGIYAIKNNLNGRMYIGSSTNIRARTKPIIEVYTTVKELIKNYSKILMKSGAKILIL